MNETKYVDEKAVSKITSRALSTLRSDRHRGVGIRYSKVGRSVRYDLRDVLEFMERRKVKVKQL